MRVRLLAGVGIVVAATQPVAAQICTNINNLIVCDNGAVGNRFGSSVYWSDGSTSAGVPGTTFVNPQTTPRLGAEPSGPVDLRVDRSTSPEVGAPKRWPSLGR